MDCTKIGGLFEDSWECSGIVQLFCNPQDCKKLCQIWELTRNPAALCHDREKMVRSTIPAEMVAVCSCIKGLARRRRGLPLLVCNPHNLYTMLSINRRLSEGWWECSGIAVDSGIASALCQDCRNFEIEAQTSSHLAISCRFAIILQSP